MLAGFLGGVGNFLAFPVHACLLKFLKSADDADDDDDDDDDDLELVFFLRLGGGGNGLLGTAAAAAAAGDCGDGVKKLLYASNASCN